MKPTTSLIQLCVEALAPISYASIHVNRSSTHSSHSGPATGMFPPLAHSFPGLPPPPARCRPTVRLQQQLQPPRALGWNARLPADWLPASATELAFFPHSLLSFASFYRCHHPEPTQRAEKPTSLTPSPSCLSFSEALPPQRFPPQALVIASNESFLSDLHAFIPPSL